MAGIVWRLGEPTSEQYGRLVLLVGSPLGREFDIQSDNRPAIYIGHWKPQQGWVPARIWGMREDEAPPLLKVVRWAELNGPDDVELRALTETHIRN